MGPGHIPVAIVISAGCNAGGGIPCPQTWLLRGGQDPYPQRTPCRCSGQVGRARDREQGPKPRKNDSLESHPVRTQACKSCAQRAAVQPLGPVDLASGCCEGVYDSAGPHHPPAVTLVPGIVHCSCRVMPDVMTVTAAAAGRPSFAHMRRHNKLGVYRTKSAGNGDSLQFPRFYSLIIRKGAREA